MNSLNTSKLVNTTPVIGGGEKQTAQAVKPALEDLNIAPYSYDDHIIESARLENAPKLRVYPFNGTAVILGRSGDPFRELYLDAVLEDSVPVFRRLGGGGSVVLDSGNLVVSLAMLEAGFGRISYYNDRLSDWLITALSKAGIKGVEKRGISDLSIGERKIAGASLYRSKGILFYTATILVNPDITLIERYLKHPSKEPEYRRGRNHREFLLAISELDKSADIFHLSAELKELLIPPIL
ncbi:MAG: hypothetical protein Kow0090_13390 [Myxococcota bacterium]